ncbi:MAG TPA: N-acetyl-1-D-myo-inositol-2-amino-2-deoxy-alpha-D-glucopyranoside deacetylase [Mycobacteriales bacterium]|nr:N-acetyl-1-D-myo-inositol-2-amino-2-deoxy-alpha-D-glucopyranoside deacetylase [Mycobacteriales bacterium]
MCAAPARRMLLVHAHPDDETIGTGAVMARYAAEGVQVTLVTCTLGEEGEVLVPALAQLAKAEADQLGGYRIHELTEAMRALGVTDHRFLGGPGRWRDSGMMGLPENDAPRAFWRADLTEATRELVTVVREVRPQVLVTYDENGGYGHPDHIQAHRVAMAAVDAAADPAFAPEVGEPWAVAKVYWTAVPRSALKRGIELMIEAGESGFFGTDSVDELPFVLDDELVTTAVDGRDWLSAKLAAMRAHASQISADGPFFSLAEKVGEEAFGIEYFRLVRGRPGPADGPDGRETDLFAGLS